MDKLTPEDQQRIENTDIFKFLDGSQDYQGVWYSDEKHPTLKGRFWWRSIMREQLAEKDERIAFLEQDVKDKEDAAKVALNTAKRRGELVSEKDKEIEKQKRALSEYFRQWEENTEKLSKQSKLVSDLREALRLATNFINPYDADNRPIIDKIDRLLQ